MSNKILKNFLYKNYRDGDDVALVVSDAEDPALAVPLAGVEVLPAFVAGSAVGAVGTLLVGIGCVDTTSDCCGGSVPPIITVDGRPPIVKVGTRTPDSDGGEISIFVKPFCRTRQIVKTRWTKLSLN